MEILAKDGVPLTLFASDMRYDDTVVMVNAPGISGAVAERLMTELRANEINFVTWDLRGSPGAGDDFREYCTTHHVDDLEAVLQAISPRRVVLASWCSGTPTALAAMVERRVAPVAFAAFCVPNFANERRSNLAGDTLERVCSVVAKDETKVGFFYDAMSARSEADAFTADLEDAQLQKLVLAPFKSGPQALLSYSYAIVNRPKPEQIQSWCAAIDVPMTFFGARKDLMVSYLDSIALARFSPRARSVTFDEWNHYGLFYDMPTVVREFRALFGRADAPLRATDRAASRWMAERGGL